MNAVNATITEATAEADAAALRRAFNRAVESYPAAHPMPEAVRVWFRELYEAVRDTTAGLKVLAELERAKQLDALRRVELADADATLADMQQRYRELKEKLARWQAEKGERAA